MVISFDGAFRLSAGGFVLLTLGVLGRRCEAATGTSFFGLAFAVVSVGSQKSYTSLPEIFKFLQDSWSAGLQGCAAGRVLRRETCRPYHSIICFDGSCSPWNSGLACENESE